MLYSCRTVPPPLQAEGLSQADQDIRHSLGRLVGSPLCDDDWRVGSIGVANGGLGTRSALEHAPAAYVSSMAQTLELCTRIWPGFDEYDLDGGLMRSDVESSLGASFLPNAGIKNSSGTPFQKSLSAKLEAKVCRHLLDSSSTNATGSRTSASIASLEPERGFLLFLIHQNPTSRHLYFGSAYVAVSACLFGPKTPTALFAARSWTNGVKTPLFAGAAWFEMLSVLPPTTEPALARFSRSLGLLIPRDPSDDDRPPGPDPPDPSSPSRRPADVWVPRGPVAVKRPGISPSPVLRALVRLRPIPPLFRESSLR